MWYRRAESEKTTFQKVTNETTENKFFNFGSFVK
jgi:hypothetical protein